MIPEKTNISARVDLTLKKIVEEKIPFSIVILAG